MNLGYIKNFDLLSKFFTMALEIKLEKLKVQLVARKMIAVAILLLNCSQAVFLGLNSGECSTKSSSSIKFNTGSTNFASGDLFPTKQAVAGEGSSAAYKKYYEFENISATNSDATRNLTCSDTDEEKEVKTNDYDDSDMDLSDDNPQGDDAAARFGVFMYKKSTEPFISTYLSSTVTCFSLEYIHSLPNDTPVHELTDLMSNPIYIDAHTTSVMANPVGNPKEMFLDEAKRLMQKEKKNMRKINFKKAVAQKFKEYAQKLETLTSVNISEVIEKDVQAKVLTEMKKLLTTHALKVVANYVKPRLNTSMREVMRNNQVNLITNPSSSADDLSKIDLKIKLPSFHKRTHDDQDPPNDREGENKKKRRKDNHSNLGWFTKKSGSSNAKRRTTWFDFLLKSENDKNKDHILRPSIVAIAKKLKELIQKNKLIIVDLEGARLEKLKQQYKNDVELEYYVDQLKAVVLTEAEWNSDEGDVSRPRSFERHMLKRTKPHPSFYNNDFYYLVNLSTEEKYTTSLTKHNAARYHIKSIEDMIPGRWSKVVYHYHIEAQNGIHPWEDRRQDFFKAEINNILPGKVYSDKRIISVVRVVVKRK
ncbi:hypothetical protein Tco_0754409 [Tanacetum coccineum]